MFSIFSRQKSKTAPSQTDTQLVAGPVVQSVAGPVVQSVAGPATQPVVAPTAPPVQYSVPTVDEHFAALVLSSIHDGVIVVDPGNVIRFINPAAATMTNYGTVSLATGLDYNLVLKIATKDGREMADAENPLIRAISNGQPLEDYDCLLVPSNSEKHTPITITVLPAGNGDKVITFRNIEKELAEENEHTEFISTASHEMRTPVATIDGYITLCLNPQTATIDDRARGYLESASKASKHLGKLFQDLLDVTKLDDSRIRPEFVPVEMTSFVKQIVADHSTKATEAGLTLTFGENTQLAPDEHRLEQAIYSSCDVNFLREILDNLIDNAVKYTPNGGSVFVNVKGDDGQALISVSDTGIGISAEDLSHVFQKFYRADNSDTREIGGTGLGLYIVKQRAEAMGGHVWAESSVGQGTTFFVSLPRISAEEYQKRLIAVQNASMINNEGDIK